MPVFLNPFILMTMPDSLAFLVRRNRTEKLKAIIQKIAPELQLDHDDRFVLPQQQMSSASPSSWCMH